ncbi:MAG: radical SAM protein [Kiritimatiellae bacterium]|nr:radical SAM protein [Kiritimatiellia bacterium]
MTDILPSVAVLELTYRCNHACRFCSCPWFGGMMTPEAEMEVAEWKRLIETYAGIGVSQFSFTGGEALMKEGCLELLDFATKYGAVGLLSNGRLVTDEIIRFCSDRNIRLSMSLPGLRTFPENTDSDTSVEKILSHFRYAHDVGCATTVGIAVTKLNLPELYETISAALLAGADSVLLNRFLPGGRGLRHPELLLTPAEVVEAADCAEAVLKRTNRTGHFGTEMPLCLIDAKKYEHLNVTTGCSAATDFFTVGPNGRLRVCNHSPIELVRWHEWKRLPDCEEWRHYMCHDYLPEDCVGCLDAPKCLGGCREAARVFHGSPLAPDPLCARTQN